MATLENDAAADGPVTGAEDLRRPRAETMKFVHASGTRPLAGYTIKRGIGAGGFGEVYFAVSDAGKEVALKRIQRNLDVEIRGVSQCLNLKHPNLVALYDIKYDDQGDAWVIMEFVAGGSLRDAIEQHPHGLPIAEVNAWFQGIGAGVAYLHDHGIVHRDLKPGNIFSDHGVVKIGDYGLSKFISCSRRSGHTESVGTFHYMAPEIGRGEYGKEIDVYALGVILFEMLTGRVPFDGETSHEIIMKHLTDTPDVTVLPDAYREVVRRALLKNPTDRFADVAEMLTVLGLATATPLVGQAGLLPVRMNGQARVAANPQTVAAATPVSREDRGAGDPVDARVIDGTNSDNAASEQPATATSPPIGTPVSSRPVVAELVREEPLAAAVRRTFQQFNRGFQQVQGPMRALAIVGLVFFLITSSGFWIPFVAVAGCLYLVYFGIYTIVTAVTEPEPSIRPHRPPMPNNVQPVAAVPPAVTAVAHSRRERWHVASPRAALKHQSVTEQLGDLVGAMLMSTLVVGVVGVLMMVVGGRSLDTSLGSLAFYTWFGMTCIAGSWTVLALGKLWEQETGDAVRRRFVMLVAGLLVGAFSYGLRQFLDVSLVDSWPMRPLTNAMRSPHIFDSTGHPLLAGYLIYFGAMFMLVRWWRQVDPLRYARLSLWDTGVVALVAWMLQMVWSLFWQPWGIMIFATISIAVQMAARWLRQADRLPDYES